MVVAVERDQIKVLKSYPQDNAWNVVISFPDAVEGLRTNSKLTGSLDYELYRIQSWTDEPVDLNEIQVAAINTVTNEYKLVKGDSEIVPERVQSALLEEARNAMHAAERTLSE